MTAKETFENIGFEYDYIKGQCFEDLITYHKDNLHIQFNLISKNVVLQNDTSLMYYNSEVFILNLPIIYAINKQIEELGWNKEKYIWNYG